jgi:hypothetical protein
MAGSPENEDSTNIRFWQNGHLRPIQPRSTLAKGCQMPALECRRVETCGCYRADVSRASKKETAGLTPAAGIGVGAMGNGLFTSVRCSAPGNAEYLPTCIDRLDAENSSSIGAVSAR